MSFSSLPLQAITLSKHKKENMKKVILLFTLLCATLAGRAQQVNGTFVDEGNKWIYCAGFDNNNMDENGFDSRATYYEHVITGEQIEVEGKVYMAMETTFTQFGVRKADTCSTIPTCTRRNSSVNNRIIGIREEDGRIYANYNQYCIYMNNDNWWIYKSDGSVIPYPKTDDGEIILYDFTLQQGDRFTTLPNGEDITVDDVVIVTDVNGIRRKLFTLSNGCQIIEGIGCVSPNAFLLNYLNPHTGYLIPLEHYNRYNGFYSFGTKDDIIYRHIFDDTHLIEVTSDSILLEQSLFDLQGRRLAAPPAKGLYIQGGRLKIGHGFTRF